MPFLSNCSFDNKSGIWDGIDEIKRIAELEIQQSKGNIIQGYSSKKSNLKEIPSNPLEILQNPLEILPNPLEIIPSPSEILSIPWEFLLNCVEFVLNP